MVFGLQLSFARVGSTVNFLVMEPIYKEVTKHYTGSKAIGVVLFLASATCAMSMACALILGKFQMTLRKLSFKSIFQFQDGWINEHNALQ